MKKVGILTLADKKSLAFSVLSRIVEQSGCSFCAGANLPPHKAEKQTYEAVTDALRKVGFKECDVVIISAPYTLSLLALPKVIACLRQLTRAPVIVGGNEASNNAIVAMTYTYKQIGEGFADCAPDIIARGAAEVGLSQLLSMKIVGRHWRNEKSWSKDILKELLDVPNIVFWLPNKRALYGSQYKGGRIPKENIFAGQTYGEKADVTFQRGCIWAKKSGGCIFCSIASHLGKDFMSVLSPEQAGMALMLFLQKYPEVRKINILDDTFNISNNWVIRLCKIIELIKIQLKRELRFGCYMRPENITQELADVIAKAGFNVFLGVDALTDENLKRFRKGHSYVDLMSSLKILTKKKVFTTLSLQLVTPESTREDIVERLKFAIEFTADEHCLVGVSLYTFPFAGSDILRLLKAREHLRGVPADIYKKTGKEYIQRQVPIGFVAFDPDVEMLNNMFFTLFKGKNEQFTVRTISSKLSEQETPNRKSRADLIEMLKTWRSLCDTLKKNQSKKMWYLALLALEGKNGLTEKEMLDLLCRNEKNNIPNDLKKEFWDFGYRYTLSRTLRQVLADLQVKRACEYRNGRYLISEAGMALLQELLSDWKTIKIAEYGTFKRKEIIHRIKGH